MNLEGILRSTHTLAASTHPQQQFCTIRRHSVTAADCQVMKLVVLELGLAVGVLSYGKLRNHSSRRRCAARSSLGVTQSCCCIWRTFWSICISTAGDACRSICLGTSPGYGGCGAVWVPFSRGSNACTMNACTPEARVLLRKPIVIRIEVGLNMCSAAAPAPTRPSACGN